MISIIVPTYNYARFLPDALNSALNQKVAGVDPEVLVIDDGSTDDTPQVLESYGPRIRSIRKANAGLSAARNTGMAEARYDWVIFLDSDDMLPAGAVSALWEAKNKQGDNCLLVAGRDRPVTVDKIPIGPDPAETEKIFTITAKSLIIRNRFACTVLANRRALLELGGFDSNLRASEDRDMWIRFAALHPLSLLDRVVLFRRLHGGSMSRAAERQTASIEQVLEKAFANPNLHLNGHDKRLARAVCLYQSALMYSEAGEHLLAARQMFRSLILFPWPEPAEAGIPPFSRVRGFVGNLRKLAKSSPQ